MLFRSWAQNLDQKDMFIDFLGDKGGARLIYGKQFEFCTAEDLNTVKSEHEIPDMYAREDEDFLKCAREGIKNRNYIDNILESAKLLDALYRSADEHRELRGDEI